MLCLQQQQQKRIRMMRQQLHYLHHHQLLRVVAAGPDLRPLCKGATTAGGVIVLVNSNEAGACDRLAAAWSRLGHVRGGGGGGGGGGSVGPDVGLVVDCRVVDDGGGSDGSSSAHNPGPEYQRLLEWSVGHGFELVDLSEARSEIDKETGMERRREGQGSSPASAAMFGEATGMARVRSALEAHLWSGMEMKDPTASISPSSPEESTQATATAAVAASKEAVAEADYMPPDLAEVLKGLSGMRGARNAEERGVEPDENYLDSFDSTLEHLQRLRAGAAHLGDAERRAYAEKVALAVAGALYSSSEDEGE
eukprot:UC1_evm4s696